MLLPQHCDTLCHSGRAGRRGQSRRQPLKSFYYLWRMKILTTFVPCKVMELLYVTVRTYIMFNSLVLHELWAGNI